MDPDDRPHDAGEQFIDILDRMQLLGDDFTAHPDDHDLILDLARVPAAAPGPAAEILPDEYCVQLELPSGSTIRGGARKLLEVLSFPPAPEAD